MPTAKLKGIRKIKEVAKVNYRFDSLSPSISSLGLLSFLRTPSVVFQSSTTDEDRRLQSRLLSLAVSR
jgi:hypothetical protein